MIELTLLLTVVFFILALFARAYLKTDVCALCAGVSLTWITLILLHVFGVIVSDPITLSVYMGGTAVGVMYMLGAKLPEKYHAFKLPFLLTLLWLVYGVVVWLVVGAIVVSWVQAGILIFLWAISLVVFLLRNTKNIGPAFKKLIECCKNW